VNTRATYQELWDQQILEQPLLDLTLADAFHDRRQANKGVVTELTALLALAVIALAVEAAGFGAAAALASEPEMEDQPKQQPPPPPVKVPPPEKVPKLPKTIWNLEKKGGVPPGSERRS
jgi:hypothetical protein